MVMKVVGGFFQLGAVFLLFLSLFFSQYMGAVEVEDGKEELLKTLIVHNEAALKRIHSYIIEQEWNTFQPYIDRGEPMPGMPQEDIKSQLWMRLTRKGEFFLLTRTEHLESASGKWHEDRFLQCVLNGNYYAQYQRDPAHLVVLWEHESLDTMRREPKEFATSWFPKPCGLDYAFGDYTSGTLGEFYKKCRPDARWSVMDHKLESDSLYKIAIGLVLKSGKTELGTVFYLDPKRDFLLRGIERYNADGSFEEKIEVELQYLEDAHAWVPRTVHDKEFEDSHIELWMTVKEVRLNPVIDDAIFNIGSFEILPNSRMDRYPIHGRMLEYRYVQGAWVPK